MTDTTALALSAAVPQKAAAILHRSIQLASSATGRCGRGIVSWAAHSQTGALNATVEAAKRRKNRIIDRSVASDQEFTSRTDPGPSSGGGQENRSVSVCSAEPRISQRNGADVHASLQG